MSKIRIERNIDSILLRSKELWGATQKRDFDGVYRLTFEVLTWIINSDDWFKQNYSDYPTELDKIDNNLILLGLRQAYNSYKHNMNIISVEEKNYDVKLTLGENEIPIERIVWLSSVELKDKDNSKSAFKAYCDLIEGQSVLQTLKDAEKILLNVYSNFKKSTIKQEN